MTSTQLPVQSTVALPRRPHDDASREAWCEYARITSEVIRREPMMTRFVDEIGGELISVASSWSVETGRAIMAAIPDGSVLTSEELRAVMGMPESVELSEDGISFWSGEFCGCGVDDTGAGTDWVYAERWSEVGRVFHGFVCAEARCRRLKQAG